ncbi:Alpha/Beta hydrolase protein [Boletus reticuloceps]|uniref:Alpha/Beta hydrolase protein n=1 Tax=Boletus reticuloceps TaxID=495285 RepID=A0A8I2Z1G2_9AGAM|nr:Alpha/Beta hydrolase protein [Boletus reticuloceps]
MSTTLAGPPSSCCWTGIKHTGTPEGRVELLGGLDTYISEPSAGATSGSHKKVLLFLSGIYGPVFINNKLLQDYFAAMGFIVLGPDYFFGTYAQDLPADQDRTAWGREALSKALEVFPKWFEVVKAKYGTETTKYTAVGYCLGAPLVLDLAAEGSIAAGNAFRHRHQPFLPLNKHLVAGAIVHPAFLKEHHFEKIKRTFHHPPDPRLSREAYTTIPTGPVLASCAEVDLLFPLEARRRAEDILVRNKSRYYFQVFSGVAHGFAVQGNPDVPHERWAQEESARGIKEWFLQFSG